MWYDGVLPDESGDEQITTRESLSSNEIESLWYLSGLPKEEAEESIKEAIDVDSNAETDDYNIIPSTNKLYSYPTNEARESDRRFIGEGYNIFVSLELKTKRVLKVLDEPDTNTLNNGIAGKSYNIRSYEPEDVKVYIVTLANESI
jgi:hypothetical protein